MAQRPRNGRVEIVYDGQCPACAAYVRLQKLQELGLQVALVDARQHPEITKQYAARGIDLNREFVVRLDDAEYSGGDAVFVLASLGGRHSWFRRLTWLLFRSRAVSRVLYVPLRLGRRLLLLALRRPPLDSQGR